MSMKASFKLLFELIILPILLLLSLFSRFFPKKIDIGIGPEPLINNVYHKMAIEKVGYSTETFVVDTYYITTDFDKIFKIFKFPGGNILNYIITYIYVIFRYKVLLIYFNGGPLFPFNFLKILEPILLKIAKVKTIVLPYGGDVQFLPFCKNHYFKHAMTLDYPGFCKSNYAIFKNIVRWTKYADYIISGCDWVDYMYHWDKLLLAHFCIDTNKCFPQNYKKNDKLKVLHAPNHVHIKGTEFLKKAVEKLIGEGYQIELKILQRVPNTKVREAIAEADLVADQFVIGWYAMFAIEAMAMGKPVMCYLREDFLNLYKKANLLEEDEPPIINCSANEIYEKLKWVLENRELLKEIGHRSRNYVIKYHSLESMSEIFKGCLEKIGISTTHLKS